MSNSKGYSCVDPLPLLDNTMLGYILHITFNTVNTSLTFKCIIRKLIGKSEGLRLHSDVSLLFDEGRLTHMLMFATTTDGIPVGKHVLGRYTTRFKAKLFIKATKFS